MWIFYSNLILQKNTTKAKIPAKTRRDQPTSKKEVAIENWGRDRKLDECLKHSSYTHVGSSFSRLIYRNFIVFVARSLILCLVWLQVQWSEKSSY